MNDFDALMGQLDPAMVVVTTVNERERAGCLVGFHSQAGIEPNALAVWLSKANHTYRVATLAEVFAVHFLTHDDVELARLFGTVSGDEVDKLEQCAWQPALDGVPVLTGCANRVIGRKRALLQTEAADHVCLILEPVSAEYGGEFRPLRLSQVAHLRAGHDVDERPAPTTTRAEERPAPS